MPKVKSSKVDNMGNNLILLSEAANLCHYSQEYLSLRARQGKLRSVKQGRNWLTTKEWLYEYLAYCEGLKEKNKPKAGLIKTKTQIVAREIEQEQSENRIKANKPEIIKNFWILLFYRVKNTIGKILTTADSHNFIGKLTSEKSQSRLLNLRQEVKLLLISPIELLRFINDWILNEQPRIKIRQILAGALTGLAVFGFLLLATNKGAHDVIGNGVARLIDK